MRVIKRDIIMILGCILSIFTSCGPSDEDIEREARLVYEQKVAQLKSSQAQECLEEAIQNAEILVDSILAQRAENPLIDSLYRPPAPNRPDFVPLDSSILNSKRSVKPIIKR